MSGGCCSDDRDGACTCAHESTPQQGPPVSGARATLTRSLRIHALQVDDCCAPETATPVAATEQVADDCCAPPAPPSDPLARAEHLPWWRDRTLLLPAISGVLVVAGLIVGWRVSEPAGLVLDWGALLAGGATFVPGALVRLRHRRLGVGLLMTIAAVGAVALGRVAEAAALAFLFSIAEALEHRAMAGAQRGLRALLDLIPQTARVERSPQEQTLPVAELQVDDVLLVAAGERVSTDGVVVSGRSGLDTSAVTGESIPVEVGPGDEVLAGSVNGAGSLRVRATAPGSDNSLTTIVRLVEEAYARKGERARLADRIARPLVPAILGLAAVVAAFGLLTSDSLLWLERALVVLVAASPCALAIAVPVTVISAIGSASRLGVVIKSGEAFEQLGTVRGVAFDKTGTLTRNEPEVVAVVTAVDFDEATVLRLAAAVEAESTHPLAAALLRAASDRPRASDVEEVAGHGLRGTVDGHAVRVGSPRWVPAGPLQEAAHEMSGRGMSLVVVEVDGQVAGLLGIRDELKPEAVETVRQLRARGMHVTMLTGDNERTARALAAEVGIDDVRAEMLPADKAAAIEELVGQRPTAMVGDGINDAPALAGATVGIAMGVTGSAAAIESADVAFTGSDLRLIPRSLEHTRRGRRLMTGNIGFALAIIVVLVPLALFGVMGLAQVVLVHEAAEVLVILNGVRAARIAATPLTPIHVTQHRP
ncbi:heavy metal translocating P-type ATPase [Nocardioides marmoraquaticus]